jgi:hypothetical protein
MTSLTMENTSSKRGTLARSRLLALVFLLAGRLALPAASPPPYDLARVQGIEHFAGSSEARTLLAKNGFVVSDPFFRQIFEPYVENALPVFITADSAWQTWQVLFEEGARELEEAQSVRLARFSRLLHEAVLEQAPRETPDWTRLASYASMGLAFQDGRHRASLSGPEKAIVDALSSGRGEALAPIGFPLAADRFRADGFYAQWPALGDYFRARQWYATVVFRLADASETRLALELARVVSRPGELSNLWLRLTAPSERLCGAMDGSVGIYAQAADRLAGGTPVSAQAAGRLFELQKELEARLPEARGDDPLLPREQSAPFGRTLKGFRLLPSGQPSPVAAFQQTTAPTIAGRMIPSGLDFFTASPELSSPAAARAIEAQCGRDVAASVLVVKGEPLAASLDGEALRLLALLQRALPPEVPPALRTGPWADQQLWTQLGAWALQRHTWVLQEKISVDYPGGPVPPEGMVAPCPDFFAGLAGLARNTAAMLDQAGVPEPCEFQPAATDMLVRLTLAKQPRPGGGPAKESPARPQQEWLGRAQWHRFFEPYFEKHATNLPARVERERLLAGLETVARRVAETGQADAVAREMITQFIGARAQAAGLLREFASVCEHLAFLASRSLAGQAPGDDDRIWLRGYGAALGRFHFYEGNSYLEPRDDFPIVTRLFTSPVADRTFCAGLARPQALYVIVPAGNQARLHQGAVLTYREFTCEAGAALDDPSWRALVSKGPAPSPPVFTRSFYSETSASELMDRLRRTTAFPGAELDPATRQALQLLQARVLPADLTNLFALLRETARRGARGLAGGLVETVGQFSWESRQTELIGFLADPTPLVSVAAASVLAQRPEAINLSRLSASFEHASALTRRLGCVLLSAVATNATAREMLVRVSRDPDDGVRWQATLALSRAKAKEAQTIAALVSRLDDTNSFVGAAAAYALARLEARQAAPLLLEKLSSGAASRPLSDEDWRRQAGAINGPELRDAEPPFLSLEVDRLSALPPRSERRQPGLRATALPGRSRGKAAAEFTFNNAVIQALGTLGYQPAREELRRRLGGASHVAAARALHGLDPDGLETALVRLALDRQAAAAARSLALGTLCELEARGRARELLPLLDDTTVLVPSTRRTSPSWRCCDHTAVALAHLLGWKPNLTFTAPLAQRERLITRLREWARQSP